MTYQCQVNTGSGFSNIFESILYTGTTTNRLVVNWATRSMDGYQFRCYVTGTCSPSQTTYPATFTVNSLPSDSILTATGHTVMCPSSTLKLSTIKPATGYQWNLGGTPISGANAATYNASSAGAYTVTVTNAVGCSFTSSIQNITVDAPVTPIITPSGATLCAAGAYASYQWYYNGSAISGATGSCYTATKNGNYTVAGTNDNGCSATSAITTLTHVDVPNVSIADGIKIYPNPANAIVHIDAPVTINVSILSIQGQEVTHVNTAKDIDISNLANGMYIMQIFDESHNLIKTSRITKN